MDFKNVNDLENFFIEQDIFAMEALKLEGDITEVLLVGENRFEKMLQFIKRNEIKTVLYQSYIVNEEDYFIPNDMIEDLMDEDTIEFLKENGYMENLWSVISQHNKQVKKHLGLLDSYIIEVINEGVLYRVGTTNFGIDTPEVVIEDFLSNYESDMEEYQNELRHQNFEERMNSRREQERKTKEALENLITENIDQLKSLPNKPSRIEYMTRIAEEKGIRVFKKDITMSLDILLSKK
ncbi:hypothetical protein [Bacillus cereus]|uniref:Uncharacterized protein n=1 Tax=Bacillus cereus TaxID=1396 RepID=A0A2B9DQK2_BACCE|nr:hypothetical protein [Bacillus cereus]PGM89299.1 hypothetical protein CN958_24810 [Bacillus cereus]